MKTKHVAIGALALALTCLSAAPGSAQQLQSRLFEVTKSKKLRVCQYPLYYSISYRDPTLRANPIS